MAESAVVVTAPRLTEFIVDALVAMKMPRATARITADLMVRTDLRGVDSHGIGMLPRYHQWWEGGYIAMDAEHHPAGGFRPLLGDSFAFVRHFPAAGHPRQIFYVLRRDDRNRKRANHCAKKYFHGINLSYKLIACLDTAIIV